MTRHNQQPWRDVENAILKFLTQGIYLLLFAVTLVGFARHRMLARLEVAALFGVLAAVILLQGFTQVTGIVLPWAATAAALLILAQPCLLLRLVGHFRPIPRLWDLAALATVLATYAVVILAGQPLPRAAAILLVVAFVTIEGVAAVALAQAALAIRGIARRRLIAIAAGSALLAAIILVAGVQLQCRPRRRTLPRWRICWRWDRQWATTWAFRLRRGCAGRGSSRSSRSS